MLAAAFAPLLWTTDPLALSPQQRLRPPSAENWLGTDQFGRDIWTRVVYGTRVSLTVGVAVAILSISIGLVVGMLAGYIRLLDSIVMRVMDGLMAIPGVLLAIALVSLSGASRFTVIVAITVPEIPRVVRLVRAVVLTVREEPYVEAAIAAGTRLPLILIRHVLPNCVPALIVQATYVCASAMLTEAILSLPRRRHAAGDPELGQHDGGRPRVLPDRAAHHPVSRRGARADDPRRQRAGRRPARPARSETRAAGVRHPGKLPRPAPFAAQAGPPKRLGYARAAR